MTDDLDDEVDQQPVPWVVMGAADGSSSTIAHCQRCGQKLTIGLPVGVGVMLAAGVEFVESHRYCRERTEEKW